ncbi:MAG: alpha-glucosidase [Faecalibacterium sp.]
MKKQWWHDKIAYQVYPKSFKDSNGDGIGDLQGIISKLDYLKDLGVDIIWMSPMYKSPFVDQGYDIADYYAVDPIFGNMQDMEQLIAEVKKRDMHLLLDLVINHCSDQHEWFQKALADPYGEYADYFYFKKGVNGAPPTNWRACFGGSTWEPVPGTDLYYLHMFVKEQPDLNFENPVVRQKIYDMINWWLEKGIDGFRVDAIINIKKDLTFSSYPADRADGLVSPRVMLSHAVGVVDVLQDIRKNTFAKHDALTIAELFDYDVEQLEAYIGEDGCFSSIFVFDTHLIGRTNKGWHDYTKPTPEQYKKTMFASQKNAGDVGLLCTIIENHDEPRGVSHYLPEVTEMGKKMLATVFMFSKGMPFFYQGQEIGMENNAFTDIMQINDVNSLDEYQNALRVGKTPAEALAIVSEYSRDNTRTPMQWDESENAGFTTGAPWLCVNEKYHRINVAQQMRDENSLLAYYKKLVALRKDAEYKQNFVYGAFVPAYQSIENVLAFYREYEGQKLLVICNFQNVQTSVSLSELPKQILVNNTETTQLAEDILTLAPYQALVLEM